jgi:hypothetical protein
MTLVDWLVEAQTLRQGGANQGNARPSGLSTAF